LTKREGGGFTIALFYLFKKFTKTDATIGTDTFQDYEKTIIRRPPSVTTVVGVSGHDRFSLND